MKGLTLLVVVLRGFPNKDFLGLLYDFHKKLCGVGIQ